MPNKKGIGLNTLTASYQIDHLAVICIIMDIPLLFVDEGDYAFGEKYYPGLKAQKGEYHEFTPEFLIENYDVLFMSDVWDRHRFHHQYAHLEKVYKKKLRHVFCPHGFSDKVFYFKACADEDIVLIYGQNMIDMFRENGILEKLNSYAVVGNYRYAFYKKHQAFYQNIVETEVWCKFRKNQPTILYAPTWLDQNNSSSFFEAAEDLLSSLPADYNMLVKLHPRLELDDIAEYYRITGKYEEQGNIVFLKDFPPVYPLLERSDIYVGDMSSVGYDFLTFNRPMFFLNKERKESGNDRSAYLFKCGTEVLPEQYKDLFKIIEANVKNDENCFSKIRSEVYQYTFGNDKTFEEIRKAIKLACQTEEKSS